MLYSGQLFIKNADFTEVVQYLTARDGVGSPRQTLGHFPWTVCRVTEAPAEKMISLVSFLKAALSSPSLFFWFYFILSFALNP